MPGHKEEEEEQYVVLSWSEMVEALLLGLQQSYAFGTSSCLKHCFKWCHRASQQTGDNCHPCTTSLNSWSEVPA